ncbi:MAG TPA: protein kinase [Gemmatimonadaceae bacterium]
MNDSLRSRCAAAFAEGYEIDAEIGRGGMGVVYRCRDVKLRRFVAIKVLPPDLAYRDEVRTRFLREAETAAQLSHPNIVPIYSVDERDGLVWFVMGLVDGESLGVRLAREPRPPLDDVKRILRDVADALAYAHDRGIIHRDIKPDNILLERATGRPIVTDFGIARAIETDSRLTVTGTAVGTPAYMSPEQAMGEGDVDGRSDLYSLAVVGYQMLAGELPFKASNTPAMLMKHLSDPLRPLRSIRADVPEPLADVVERCLAKKPHQRWKNAAEFREAIDALPPDDGSTPPGHVSSSWKRAAVSLPPMPESPFDRPPAARLPRLTRRGALDRRGEFPPAQLHARASIHRRDAESGDAPPIPSFMPDSWRDARQEWARRGGEASPRQGRERSGESRILEFRHALARTAVGATGLGVINAAFSPAVPWAIIPIAVMSLGLLRRAGGLWADGIRLRDVLGARASANLASRGTPDRSESSKRSPTRDELARQLAPADVLAGPFGETVRRAAADRVAAQDALARLAPADRELIPDVGPTLNDLAERVAQLAQALHGLERAAEPAALSSVEQRIAEASAQPESPAQARRLEMLERQRETLADLVQRRERLKEQLDSASLMLQSMRLDLLALGSAGVQSAMNDVTGATQEARALSRDLRIALEAAKELRT